MNANKLQQDHPCVIETIRRYYLNKPSPPHVPLKLDSDDDDDRSPGQTGVIFRLLKNRVWNIKNNKFSHPILITFAIVGAVTDERIFCGMWCPRW